jgi:hypothetical protein
MGLGEPVATSRLTELEGNEVRIWVRVSGFLRRIWKVLD